MFFTIIFTLIVLPLMYQFIMYFSQSSLLVNLNICNIQIFRFEKNLILLKFLPNRYTQTFYKIVLIQNSVEIFYVIQLNTNEF